MKKIFLVLLGCFLLTGCGNVELDLDKISTNLDKLSTDKFNILGVTESVERDDKIFKDLYDVFDYDLDVMNITSSNIEQMVFRVDANTTPAYMVFKPKEGKKEAIKKDIDEYLIKFDNLKQKMVTEYEGNIIYIFSDNNEEVLRRIKEADEKVFGVLFNVENKDLENLIGLKTDLVDEFVIKNSVITQANSYYIIKPKEGKKEEVKKIMDDYMKRLEEQWKTYLPDQYELVKNRLEEQYGEYLIYIISNDNKLVLKTIKNYKK